MARVYRALTILVAVTALAVAVTTLSGFFYVRQVRSVGGFLPSFFPEGNVGGWPLPFMSFDSDSNIAFQVGGLHFNPYFFAFDLVLCFLLLLLLTPLLLWTYSKLRRHPGQ